MFSNKLYVVLYFCIRVLENTFAWPLISAGASTISKCVLLTENVKCNVQPINCEPNSPFYGGILSCSMKPQLFTLKLKGLVFVGFINKKVFPCKTFFVVGGLLFSPKISVVTQNTSTQK